MSNRIVSIIVTFRIKDYIGACLESIVEQTYHNYEIIVIDNSLNKDFGQQIIKSYPEVKFYQQEKNLSYSAALNLGVRQSVGKFILCLNDDVRLDKRFIEEALRGFLINSRVGIVSGKVFRSDRKTLDTTGLFLSPWRTARERGYGKKDTGRFEKEEYIFGVSGAVAFYRKEMLEDIKENGDYFDPDFGYFYEDLDIAWRANRYGWKGYYIPSAIAYHVRGGTVRRDCGIDKSYARRYINNSLHSDLIKNRYLCTIKNESCLGFLLHLSFIIIYDFVVWCYILFFRSIQVRCFMQNIKHFKNAVKKRRAAQKRPF